jgi:IS5 family transposase
MVFRDEGAYRIDAYSRMVHSISMTAANVSDRTEAGKVIREDDEFVNADAGYRGIEKREEIKKDEQVRRQSGG